MKNILKDLQKGITVGVGIVLVLGVVHAWNGLQADSGDTLSTAKWNELVDKVENLETNIGSGSLGVGQTWQNVTGSRSLGTDFVNNTGKPIEVNVFAHVTAGNTVSLNYTIDGIYFGQTRNRFSETAGYVLVNFTVPNGSTYMVNGTNFTTWVELR